MEQVLSLEIMVDGLNRLALQINERPLVEDIYHGASVSQAAERFEQLRSANTLVDEKMGQSSAQKAIPKSVKNTNKSAKWRASLANMRRSYPNAFKPWRTADDEKLKALYSVGIGLDDLTKEFGRQPGSIRTRLRKHYGNNVSVA